MRDNFQLIWPGLSSFFLLSRLGVRQGSESISRNLCLDQMWSFLRRDRAILLLSLFYTSSNRIFRHMSLLSRQSLNLACRDEVVQLKLTAYQFRAGRASVGYIFQKLATQASSNRYFLPSLDSTGSFLRMELFLPLVPTKAGPSGREGGCRWVCSGWGTCRLRQWSYSSCSLMYLLRGVKESYLLFLDGV